ncbi:unnamed protein product [Allacma fusca]|uniref:SEC14-like protein 2 n=1 Tax=Allacma fusca TaxID=39272 RepID=A0A8J2LGS6_9HEXA|nr:unnamed protein product [Allacma fusca]
MSSLISTEESDALIQFRMRIGDIIEKLDEYDSHDQNLVRWLRARDLNVKNAETLIRESMKWREENQMDELQFLPLPETFLEQFQFGACGHDKQGTVICVAPFGAWRMKKIIQAGQGHQISLYIAQIFEKYFRYAKNTNTVENMKTQIILLFDFDQFSLQEFISKQVVDTLIQIISVYEANYPERLKAAYVVNISKFFQILWSILTPFLPARTLSKFHLLGGSPETWRKSLLESMDYQELPSWFGGSNTAFPYFENRFNETWPPRAGDFPPEDFTTTVIDPRETLVRNFEISVGNRISWNFSTEAYDIGFEFHFNGERMFPYTKVDSHLHVMDGCLDVIKAGTYSLIFDNTYSKYRSKTLRYAIRVESSPSSKNC